MAESKSFKDTLSDINTHSKENVGKSFKGRGDEAAYGSVRSKMTGKAINPLTDRLGINPADINTTVGGIEAIKMGAGDLYRGITDATKHKNSIIGMAKANIFEFPVFISDSVPLEYATATNSLLEQVYASYLQMAISINPVVDYRVIPKRQDKSQFAKFKTNTTKYLECVDLSFQKDSCHAEYVNEDGTYIEFNMMSIEDSDAIVINEAVDYQPLSEFDHYFQEAKHSVRTRTNPNGTQSTEEIDEDDEVLSPEQQEDRRLRNQQYRAQTANSRISTKQIKRQMTKLGYDNKATEDAKHRTGYTPQFAAAMTQIHDWQDTERIGRELDRFMKEGHPSPEFQQWLNEIDRGLQLKAQTSLTNKQSTLAEKQLQLTGKQMDQIDANINKLKQDLDNAKQQHEISQKEYGLLLSKCDAYAAYIRKYGESPDTFDYERERRKLQLDEAKNRREEEKHRYEMGTRKASQFIDESKIQKMNTMKPLMMVTTMYIKSKDGNVSHPIEYVVGVKTHCRLIESSMLPEVVQYPLKEMNKVSRKAKWRAGELKFFKDILFHVKEKKQTAIDAKDPRRKWFRRLYELAHMKGDGNVSRQIAGSQYTHGLIPNATIIISKSDVDHIEDVTGIDMLKGSTARGFCEQLFLMNFIVIDTDAESIKILTPDINNDFEVQSLAAVNKQIAQLDTAGATTRDVFKMLK